MQSGSPDKALTPPSGWFPVGAWKYPPVALRLPGLRGVQSGSPDKALTPPSGWFPAGAWKYPPVALR
ncbi:hypothetical protein GR294_01370 [Raoultella sp. Lac2]|uniref:hypothetical protein n=1 Tax=unclassified Raoultella TaxID=2627600 RepID=UPI0013554255|nr:hypothetical protein [Raoultella sp. Lac2]MXF97349.1 hypothetical protein [Raoultella sp. Lac1]